MLDLVQAIGAVFRERYEIQGALGEGGFGTVYQARQLTTGQSVAIKVLRLPEGSTAQATEKRIARFQREMQICAQMHHPNIVRLIDSGQADGGIVYTVFEFLPGKNLAELLVEEGRIDPAEARHFMMQVLDALACAHGASIVHRDLKPANIMIVSTGARRNALVLDFGIGALTQETRRDEGARITLTNESIGTPSYAAPEQLRGQPPTPRSDLYAWGLVFIECLTGKRVVDGETVAEVVFKQLSPDPIPIPNVVADHALGRILRRVTAKDPAAREATAEGLLHEVEGCDISGLRQRTGPVRIDPAPSDAATATVQFASTAKGRAPRLVEGERRQITALCCNLGAACAGPKPADVEELDHVLGVQQEACAEIARRFEGHVAGALGDAVLFYFGYPTAREDDAGRAARAALAMVTEIRRRGAALLEERQIRVDVRAGIHTGLVVSRELGDPEQSRIGFVVGSTPKLAARLAGLSEPGGVLVSGSTQRLLRKQFALEESGLRVIDDSTLPVELFVLREGDPSAGSRDLPLVGRRRELEMLVECWGKACGGAGQAVLVSGEPGIGKSRLARELAERIGEEPHTWLESRAAPDGASSAFSPIIELLDRMLDPLHDAGAEAKASKLEALLSLHGFELPLAMPLFAPLLSLSLPQRWAPLDVSPQKKRELTRNAVLSLLVEMAEKEPVVLVIEDLHWADPSTIELLGQLVGEVGSARVLALFTARPEFTAPWPSTSFLPIQLGRFGRLEVEQMVAKVTSGRALPAEVLEAIAGRTDGVPLFVEELVLTMIETGALVERDGGYVLAKRLEEVSIPATLRDSLVARLDRLGRAKETAQVASAIGREFTFELLRAVSPLAEAAAQEDLDRLVAAELVFRRRQRKNPAYIFKHALVRDAAYESMLKRSRVEVHARIAHALESRFPDVAKAQPELLKIHYAGAQMYLQAAAQALNAGRLAAEKSADREAERHLLDALGWVEGMDGSREVKLVEVQIRNNLAVVLQSTRGFAAPEVEATLEKVVPLLAELGDSSELFGLRWARWSFLLTRARHQEAVRLAEENLEIAEKSDHEVNRLAAHVGLGGGSNMCLGRMSESQRHLDAAERLYDADRLRPFIVSFGQDIGVMLYTQRTSMLLTVGLADQAMNADRTSLEIARRNGFAHAVCLSLGKRAQHLQQRGDCEGVLRTFAEIKPLCEKHGLPYWLLFTGLLACWASAPDDPSALDRMAKMVSRYRGSGALIYSTYWLHLLSDACVTCGAHARAEEHLRDALAFADEHEERLFEPEIDRVRGALRVATGDPEGASESFSTAIAVARRQGSKLYELRGALDLGRLLHARGQRTEAREILAPVRASFTEGADLRWILEADALLSELGGPQA